MSSAAYKITISITSGKGGNGCISFRREKRITKGGPDGGNGGKGGDIIFQGDNNLVTLLSFKHKRSWKAGNGSDGSSQDKTGKNGESITIYLPYGTEIWDEDCLLCDITTSDKYTIAQGGEGGLGNAFFAAADLTTPYISTQGQPAEEKNLTLLLKHMADVGVIGLPNVGKSTLVSELTNAKVKIGDYAFSTIEPVVGVLKCGNRKTVLADLPGLIEGSHKNRGLGCEFLQHLSRCKAYLHLVDASAKNPVLDYETIQNEIKAYDPDLLKKTCIICLSKADLVTKKTVASLIKKFDKFSNQVIPISQLEPGTLEALKRILSAI